MTRQPYGWVDNASTCKLKIKFQLFFQHKKKEKRFMMVFINFGIRFIQHLCCLEFRIDPWSVCLFVCLSGVFNLFRAIFTCYHPWWRTSNFDLNWELLAIEHWGFCSMHHIQWQRTSIFKVIPEDQWHKLCLLVDLLSQNYLNHDLFDTPSTQWSWSFSLSFAQDSS